MISETYSELILEQILREILKEGSIPSVSEIEERYDDFIENNDISLPLFIANNYHVSYGEAASATKFNNVNNAILKDLKVLYKHLFKISDQVIKQFDRWRAETNILEARLIKLEDRISSLLLLESDIAGYFNYSQDNFTDTSNIDLENTTAYVDLSKGIISIGTSTAGATRIDLSTLTNKEIEFAVLSSAHLVTIVPSPASQRKYVVSDVSNFWQERVYMSKPVAVSVELKIKLLSQQTISRIDIDLHMSNQNSPVQLTPLYSTDNYNWNQLDIANYTRSITDKTSFQFAPVEAQYIKFIITKVGHDQVANSVYIYEFGVDEISFYNEGFAENEESVFISKTFSMLKKDGSVEEFSKIACEVCEDIPENTNIDYYIAVSNTDPVPLTSFVGIDPLTRATATKPTLLDFGDISPVVISGIHISHDESSTDSAFVNPAKDYTFVNSISGTTPEKLAASTTTEAGVRYFFHNNNDHLLDHQFNTDIIFATGTIELWRNVSSKGSSVKVRGYSNGWGYVEPFYKTTVYVENASGVSIDFGSKYIIVDEEIKTGLIFFSQGRHLIKVHKDNWKVIDETAVTNLSELKVADSLYPYNHKYLIEGYNYPSEYPTIDEKIYFGFDIVAEYFMTQISVFDFINNIKEDDYSKFAIDLDAEDSARIFDSAPADVTDPTNVFLVKVNNSISDFTNETFTLKFKAANTLYKYIRFKAVLKTEDTNMTPIIDSYRIKVSS